MYLYIHHNNNSVDYLTSFCSGTFVISDLEPFTEYFVGVATQTFGPLGIFSADYSAMTRGDSKSRSESNSPS